MCGLASLTDLLETERRVKSKGPKIFHVSLHVSLHVSQNHLEAAETQSFTKPASLQVSARLSQSGLVSPSLFLTRACHVVCDTVLSEELGDGG